MEIPWNYVGSFANVAAIWSAFPNGGTEGDYATIGGVVYCWNKYYRIWENAATVTEGTARRVDTFDGNVNIQNNLTVAGTLRAKRLKQPNCGMYANYAALTARYPSPEVGMWAAVADEGSSTGYVLYRCDTDGSWANTETDWEVDTDFVEEWEDRIDALEDITENMPNLETTVYGTTELDSVAVADVEGENAHSWYITASGVVSRATHPSTGKSYYEVVKYEVTEGKRYTVTIEGSSDSLDSGTTLAWCVYNGEFDDSGTLAGVSASNTNDGCNEVITIPSGGTSLYLSHRVHMATRPYTAAYSVRELGTDTNNRITQIEHSVQDLAGSLVETEYGFPALGKRPNGSGVLIDQSTLNCTDYIPYSEGLYYTGWSTAAYFWWYDSEKRFLGLTPKTTIQNSAYNITEHTCIESYPLSLALSESDTSTWRDSVAYVRAVTYVYDAQSGDPVVRAMYNYGTITPTIEQRSPFAMREDLESLDARVSVIEAMDLGADRIAMQATEPGYYTSSGSIGGVGNAFHTPKTEVGGYRYLWYCTRLAGTATAVAFFDENGDYLSNVSLPGTNNNTNLIWGVVDMNDSTYASVDRVSVSIYNKNHADAKYFRAVLCNEPLPERGISRPLKVLIFGDSQTDNAHIVVGGGSADSGLTPIENGAKTTAYYNRHLSANYSGNIWDKWPFYMEMALPIIDMRNYALSGASYKTRTRNTANEERQALAVQVTLALADTTNSNGVFPTGSAEDPFYPDIVIFSLGTNDAEPNDTAAEAMAVTASSTDALIAALDSTKFCQAARKEFLRVRRAWPKALMFCSLPVQRTARDQITCNEQLRIMAGYYGMILIEADKESGVTRDLYTDLLHTDGLHLNGEGQKAVARCVIANVLRNYYTDAGVKI